MTTQRQPADASGGREGLVSALAYALSRADPKMDHTETSRGYAERLAPLVIESGWLTTPPAPTPASEDELRKALVEIAERCEEWSAAAVMAGQGEDRFASEIAEAARAALRAVPAEAERDRRAVLPCARGASE